MINELASVFSLQSAVGVRRGKSAMMRIAIAADISRLSAASERPMHRRA